MGFACCFSRPGRVRDAPSPDNGDPAASNTNGGIVHACAGSLSGGGRTHGEDGPVPVVSPAANAAPMPSPESGARSGARRFCSCFKGGVASTASVFKRGMLLNSARLSFCALRSALSVAAVEAAMSGVTSRPTRRDARSGRRLSRGVARGNLEPSSRVATRSVKLRTSRWSCSMAMSIFWYVLLIVSRDGGLGRKLLAQERRRAEEVFT